MTPILDMQATFTSMPRPATASTPLSRSVSVLLVGFLLFTFVGTHPFDSGSADARSEGNILDRFAALSLFLLSLGILLARWRLALSVLIANLPLFVLVGFCALSVVWSDYPDLTLRRSILLIFLTTMAFALAVGTTDLRRLHTVTFVTVSLIMLVNLAGTIAVPSLGMSPIGAKGMYTQKNVAGYVAMIAMIIGVTWIFGCRRTGPVLLALGSLLITAVFLVMTRSKTSIALAVLAVAIIGFFAMAERLGRRFILFSAAVGMVGLGAGLVWLALMDFDLELAITSIVGDASFSGRDELWVFARREAEKRAWLGHGYGAFWDVGKLNDPLTRTEPGSWLSSVEIGVINQAHHGYLELWLHIGFPATVLATLIVLYSGITGAAHAVFGAGSRQIRAAFAAFSTLLLIYLLHNQTEATLFMRGAIFCNIATLAILILSRARDFTKQEREWP